MKTEKQLKGRRYRLLKDLKEIRKSTLLTSQRVIDDKRLSYLLCLEQKIVGEIESINWCLK